MCGICGIIHFDNKAVNEKNLSSMMLTMKHRGPDDEGIFLHNNIGLAFVRLSIIDLTDAGHQPMFSSDGRYVIIFNGEIFNYIELRLELIELGHKFISKTDTEVLLAAYTEWGKEMLHKLNGMWAFAIYDIFRQELFCARDRYGIKPFYYCIIKNSLFFASEIQPILKVIGKKPKEDKLAIFDFLVFNRTDQTDRTFFDDIKKLPHGHTLTIPTETNSAGDIRIYKWYNLKQRVAIAEPFKTGEEYRNVLSSSIGLRLRSDVPVGVCLSGGLDSSSIVSVLLQDYKKNDLKTFSAVYGSGKTGDESKFIKLYEGNLQNMFYTTPTAETLLEDITPFIKAHAEPIASTGPYAQFKVMELAKENVVVTLDGQGADESLGGYNYFFGFFFKELLKKRRLTKLSSELINYIRIHKSFYGLKTFIYFLLPELWRTDLRLIEKSYITKDYYKSYRKYTEIGGELYGSAGLHEALVNHFEFKLEHLLKWEDRNSMTFSLEARVPFLDYRLVEKTLAMESDMIIKNGMTKNILREAMKETLPEAIRNRTDKIGFSTPEDEWFRGTLLKKYILSLTTSDSFKSREFWDTSVINKMYLSHLSGRANFSREIWKWIHLENWFRIFID